MIEILATGPVNAIQDAGRFGYRAQGVSTSGAMDPVSMRAGNLLAGNPETAATLEIQSFPLRLRFTASRRFAVTGAVAPMTLGGRPLPANWTAVAEAGEELVIDRPSRGARCYLALAGGLDVPDVLGSRSTHLRNDFGGFEGREIRPGDVLGAGTPFAIRAGEAGVVSPMAHGATAFGTEVLTVRAVAGADLDMFDAGRRRAFWDTEWRITPQSNRSGYRLRGEALTLPAPVSLYSYGVVPGIVQVPPSGEPIIQMADANTAGGYPRIGGVIEADLWKLGQAAIGSRLRFERVDFRTAAEAMSEVDTYLAAVRRAVGLLAG